MNTKKTSIPSIHAPRGYHFKITNGYSNVIVQLLDKKNQEVGHVNLIKYYPYDKDKRLATHSWLNADLRGKGIGTIIYAKAIAWGLKHGYKVKSSGGSSEDAQRVWKGSGIREHFAVRCVATSKKGYVSDTWYARAKAVTKKDRAQHNKTRSRK